MPSVTMKRLGSFFADELGVELEPETARLRSVIGEGSIKGGSDPLVEWPRYASFPG